MSCTRCEVRAGRRRSRARHLEGPRGPPTACSLLSSSACDFDAACARSTVISQPPITSPTPSSKCALPWVSSSEGRPQCRYHTRCAGHLQAHLRQSGRAALYLRRREKGRLLPAQWGGGCCHGICSCLAPAGTRRTGLWPRQQLLPCSQPGAYRGTRRHSPGAAHGPRRSIR